jgi:hypothetical protein
MLFVAMTHLAEELCLNALLAFKAEIILPYRHTNINIVQDGMAICFALENIDKK